MKKLLIFTGAGFSKALDEAFPTTNEILQQINSAEPITNLSKFRYRTDFANYQDPNIQDVEHLAQVIYKDYRNRLKRVIGELEATLSPQQHPPILISDESIERPILYSQRWVRTKVLDEITSRLDALQKALSYINTEVLKRLASVQLDSDRINKLQKFITDLKKHFNLNIFSTNYDKVIGLIQQSRYYYLKPHSDEIDIKKIINQQHDINYFPLKGMVDWRFSDDRQAIYQGLIPGSSIADAVVMTLENDAKYEDLQFPHKELYGKFKQELQTADYLLFIGFSFRDERVVKLLKQRIEQNKANQSKICKIVIINKEKSGSAELLALEKKIQEIFAQHNKVKLYTGGFDFNAEKVIRRLGSK